MKDNKKKIFIGVSFLVLVAIGVFLVININTPKLSLKEPSKNITSSQSDEIVIPVVLSKLPNEVYPAASVVIDFDKNKLDFEEIKIGTMESYDDYDESKNEEPRFKIPNWAYNVDVANEQGKIKAMYLDNTASKNSYNKDGFEKNKKDIPFQIVFKLKDSVMPKDELKISILEAVFATVNGDKDKTTLSTKDGYGKLKVDNLKLKIN